MSMQRFKFALVLAVLLTAATVTQAVEPPVWTPIGPTGVEATDLFYDPFYQDTMFLATPDGYLYYERPSGTWIDRQEPGSGRELTAASVFFRPYSTRMYLLARRGADGHGVIELDLPFQRGETRYTARAGAVSGLQIPGLYDPIAVACTRALGETPGELVASADSGRTWTELTGHGQHDLTDLDCMYTEEYVVTGDAGVAHTEDGGATWQTYNDGLPAGTVLGLGHWYMVHGVPDLDKELNTQLFLAMADGVYYAATAGDTWQLVLSTPAPRQIFRTSTNFPPFEHVIVLTGDGHLLYAIVGEWNWEDLTGSLADQDLVGVVTVDFPTIYLATATTGVYEGTLDEFVSVPEAGIALRLTAAPNPFNATTTFAFEAAEGGRARLSIHDARGRRIATLLDRTIAPGPVSLKWQPRNLASGLYLARLELNGVVTTRSVMLVE